MHNRRIWISSTFAALLAASAFVVSSDAQPNTVKKIVDGVWFREGDIKNQGHCNNIIIEMKDYLIMVDANFPSGARLALEDAKKVSKKPVKYVFDTHHHGDHAYGNSFWTKQGAITLAHVGVANEMKRLEPTRWQAAMKEREDIKATGEKTVEPPKETFSENKKVINDGSRIVEFHFLGHAHTRGDGFVFLPKEKVIATGDAVVNGPFNYTADGNITNWPNVVNAAIALGATHVLPAHGPSGGVEILKGEHAFMTELRKAVEAEVKKGKKLTDIVKLEKGEAKSTSVKLPDSVKNWVGDFLPAQVKDAYGEVTQKKSSAEVNAK